MGKMPFVPDRGHAARVFTDLAGKWSDDSLAFQHLVPPERAYLPDSVQVGSLEHAWWLFFTGWLSRQGYSADQVFTGAQYIFDEYGTELVDPGLVASLKVKDYDDIKMIVPYGEKEPERVEVWWRGCLEMLRDRYLGDPRNIMLTLDFKRPIIEIRSALLHRFENFYGIGHKIAQLTIGWFQEAKWTQDLELWEDVRRIPVVAIDLWWMRLAYQFGLVNSYTSDITTKISRPLSDFVSVVCCEAGINHNHLAQAVWHIGKHHCRLARHRWANRKPYRQTCVSCPACEHCRGIVPANSHRDTHSGKKVVHAGIGWGEFQPHLADESVNLVLRY